MFHSVFHDVRSLLVYRQQAEGLCRLHKLKCKCIFCIFRLSQGATAGFVCTIQYVWYSFFKFSLKLLKQRNVPTGFMQMLTNCSRCMENKQCFFFSSKCSTSIYGLHFEGQLFKTLVKAGILNSVPMDPRVPKTKVKNMTC